MRGPARIPAARPGITPGILPAKIPPSSQWSGTGWLTPHAAQLVSAQVTAVSTAAPPTSRAAVISRAGQEAIMAPQEPSRTLAVMPLSGVVRVRSSTCTTAS